MRWPWCGNCFCNRTGSWSLRIDGTSLLKRVNALEVAMLKYGGLWSTCALWPKTSVLEVCVPGRTALMCLIMKWGILHSPRPFFKNQLLAIAEGTNRLFYFVSVSAVLPMLNLRMRWPSVERHGTWPISVQSIVHRKLDVEEQKLLCWRFIPTSLRIIWTAKR